MRSSLQTTRLTGLFVISNLQRLYNVALDLVFPPTCAHCARVDHVFCPGCLQELASIPVQLLTQENNTALLIAATGDHNGILRSAVTGLKYASAFSVADMLAHRVTSILPQLDLTIDMVVPVPLHTSRLRERGYNQAKEISRRVAQWTNLPHQPDAISRIRSTRSQVGLDRKERHHNMKDAFHAQENLVTGKTLLLIDDVLTTGATLTACSEAAFLAGAQRVIAVTITAAQV
jgi:ComF family protein